MPNRNPASAEMEEYAMSLSQEFLQSNADALAEKSTFDDWMESRLDGVRRWQESGSI
jgi:hypothetical protein